MPYFVYILQYGDGSYYVGQADDMQARLELHQQGKAAAHTAQHLPVRLMLTETYQTRELAVKRELQLKRWTRAKKEALIAGDFAELRRLAMRKIG